MKQDLRRFLALHPEIAGSRSSGRGPTVTIDVDPKIRDAVSQAVRAEIPFAWIIVAPRDRFDKLVPPTADCLGVSDAYRAELADRVARGEALNPWVDQEVDLLVKTAGRLDGLLGASLPTKFLFTVDPALIEPVKAAGLGARVWSFLRSLTACQWHRHRTVEQRTSVCVLLVCRDCKRQVNYRSR